MNDINDIDYVGEKIIIGGKERILRLTIPGTRYLAKKYGSVEKAFNKFAPEKNKKLEITEEFIDSLMDFLFSCLIHEDPELKLMDIEKYIDFANITPIFYKIQNAIKGSMPKSKEEGTNNQGE